MRTSQDNWNVEKDSHGWPYIDFVDAYEKACCLKLSSIIDDTGRGFQKPGSSCIWLGTKNDNMMHLHRTHVIKLVAVLERWLNTFSLEERQVEGEDINGELLPELSTVHDNASPVTEEERTVVADWLLACEQMECLGITGKRLDVIAATLRQPT